MLQLRCWVLQLKWWALLCLGLLWKLLNLLWQPQLQEKCLQSSDMGRSAGG